VQINLQKKHYLSSPMEITATYIKENGTEHFNKVYRVGYSAKSVQNATQNFIHRGSPVFGICLFNGGRQNLYNKYAKFYTGGYSYSGYYSPYTLW